MAEPSASVDPKRLRSAIQFAVDQAATGGRDHPDTSYPAALKPFLRESRVPAHALRRLRRAIEADPEFRARVAAAATSDRVDRIGMEWLRHEENWQDRVAALVAEADEAAEEERGRAALHREERKRRAAEEAAERNRNEAVRLAARVDDLTRQVESRRRAVEEGTAELVALRAELTAARTAGRHANDRLEAERGRSAALQDERDEARRRAARAEAQRDDLLATRAERSGVGIPSARMGELTQLARAARDVSDRLGRIVDVPAVRRRPLVLPGGVARDSQRATEHLLRAAGATVLVDGYNVAKLGWPDLELSVQRERCLEVVDDVARRFSTEITVVFDGAEVVGAHARNRHLARVTYSPPGVTADDVIRREVDTVPPERPVVVVTNDQAVRRDVAGAGANVVNSDAFLRVARR